MQIGENVDIDLAELNFDIEVFDDPNMMRDELRKKNEINNKARMVAGYCYDWNVKNHRDEYDIYLENNFKAKWNLENDKVWAINPNSFEEVGCIHTAQGLEFDYVGVIIGQDLRYDEINHQIIIDKTKISKDYCYYLFKNGSFIDNLTANEKTRGKRRTAGVLEECASMDGKILQEVLIPMMSISRTCADGTRQKDEALNKGELYITTAGYKNTFPYDKLIQVLVKMVVDPGTAFVLGGTYKIPVLVGQYEKTFVQDQKRDETFNEAAFGREYESRWSGSIEDAFFRAEWFDRNRILLQPTINGIRNYMIANNL